MITSIFKRSKPINFVILVILLIIGSILFWYTKEQVALTSSFIIKQLLLLGVVILSSFTVDFIVKKNQLSKQNNYTILLYVLLFLLLRNSFESGAVIVSNFFILLALRRIISLKSNIDISKKLFDAAVWITVAVCFYPWAIAFYGVLYLGIVFYASKNHRNWLIPIVGTLTVAMIAYTSQVLINNTFLSLDDLKPIIQFPEFSKSIGTLLILSVIMFFSTLSFFRTLNKKKLVVKRSYIVIFITFLVTVILFAFNRSNAIYLLFPASIIITNFYQEIKSKLIKELVTIAILLGVFLNYFLNF